MTIDEHIRSCSSPARGKSWMHTGRCFIGGPGTGSILAQLPATRGKSRASRAPNRRSESSTVAIAPRTRSGRTRSSDGRSGLCLADRRTAAARGMNHYQRPPSDARALQSILAVSTGKCREFPSPTAALSLDGRRASRHREAVGGDNHTSGSSKEFRILRPDNDLGARSRRPWHVVSSVSASARADYFTVCR